MLGGLRGHLAALVAVGAWPQRCSDLPYGEVSVETTILVVDDKASVRTVLRDYLTEEGFRVVTADNGRQALGFVRLDVSLRLGPATVEEALAEADTLRPLRARLVE